MTMYMGYTKHGYAIHLIEVTTGYETYALCGTKLHHYVTKYWTGDPVPFCDHWLDHNTCHHCKGIVEQ